MSYISLHNHSTFSIRDGYIDPEAYVKKAKEMGMNAIAVTDHGNMHAAIRLWSAAKKEGIKGIIGCEIYVSAQDCTKKDAENKENFHLTLLVKDQQGYSNLCQILTKAHTKGFYYVPRIDKKILKDHGQGLVALSGCLKGEVPNAFLHKGDEEANKLIDEYHDIFGDNYYFEIMESNYSGQPQVNAKLKEQSKKRGIPMVFTNDCHYLTKDQAFPQEIMHTIGMKKNYYDRKAQDEANPDKSYLGSGENYMKNEEQIRATLKEQFDKDEIDKMFATSQEIADKCDFQFSFDGYRMPKFENLDDKQAMEKVRQLCRDGWGKKIKPKNLDSEATKRYADRVKHELEIIERFDFMHYFLMVWDVGRYCDENRIMRSPGRGSVGGSLAAFLLSITDIDPIEHGLLFERFLNAGRFEADGGGLPDIDVDVPTDKRDQVILYLKEKWGYDKVVQLSTYGTMATKNAIKNVGRALGIEFTLLNKITSLIPKRAGSNLRDFLDGNPEKEIQAVEELQEFAEMYPELFSVAQELEGAVNHVGRHASAIVISDRPITDDTPLWIDNNTDSLVCAFDMYDTKSIGLVQMDFLGLTELSIMKDIVDDINKYLGKHISTKKIDVTDQKVWDLFCEGDTFGVFQFSSNLMRNDILKQAKPRSLSELAACNAIGRPGNLDAGTHLTYMKRKHGFEPVEYLHPTLSTILEETFGILVYQEQSIRIAREMGGFSLADADVIRKGIGKKNEELFLRLEKDFFAGAKDNRVPEDIVIEIWKLINYMSRYAFNKSHAIGYSLLAFRTAYFKTYYPIQYYYAMLKYEHKDQDKIGDIVRECYFKDVKLMPPDLKFNPKTRKVDELILPFITIKNFGRAPARHLWSIMPFIDLKDFFSRIDYSIVNEKTIKALIACGAFESMTDYREEIIDIYRANRKIQTKANTNQGELFGIEIIDRIDREPAKVTMNTKVKEEREALGFNMRYSMLTEYSKDLETCDYLPIDLEGKNWNVGPDVVTVGGVIEGVRDHIDKKGGLMAFFKITGDYGNVNSLSFAKHWGDIKKSDIKNGDVVKAQGRIDQKNFIVSAITKARANE